MKVLDHRLLRVDDTADESSPEVDREYWKSKASEPMLRLVDDVLSQLQAAAPCVLQPNYTRSHIGLKCDNRVDNFVVLRPRKKHLNMRIRTEQAESLRSLLEESDIEAEVTRTGRLKLALHDPTQINGAISQVLAAVASEHLGSRRET